MSAASPTKPGVPARVANWTIAHRRVTLACWLAILIVVSVGARAVGTRQATNFNLPGTDTQRAIDLLKRQFPAQAGDEDQIVLRATGGRIDAPALRARISRMLRQVARSPHVSDVVSPFSLQGSGAISRDGRIAFATVDFDQRANQLPKAAIDRVISLAEASRSGRLQVELGGQAIEQAQQRSFGLTTAIGLFAAIVVLLITFGSLVAMGLPIVTALLGLGTGLGLIALVPGRRHARLRHRAGGDDRPRRGDRLLAVHRHALPRGLPTGAPTSNAAVVVAMDTAGRAVLFAGCTVIIALLGMFALGVSFLYGVAVAASLAVLLTMLASLTLLPALLSRSASGSAAVAPQPPHAGAAGGRGRGRRRGLLAALGGCRSSVTRGRPPSPGSRSCSLLAAPALLDAPGLQRRRQRPARSDHAPGLRPARPGLRQGLQRPAAGGDDTPARRRPRRPSPASPRS